MDIASSTRVFGSVEDLADLLPMLKTVEIASSVSVLVGSNTGLMFERKMEMKRTRILIDRKC